MGILIISMITSPQIFRSTLADAPPCPAGTTFNATTSQCEATPICPALTTYNGVTDKCEATPTCSVGTYNTSTNQCEDISQPFCFNGSLNTATDQCEDTFSPDCQSPAIYNSSTNQCEEDGQPTGENPCPFGGTLDTALDQCVQNEGPPDCPYPSFYNGTTDQCEFTGQPDCFGGTLDTALDQCVQNEGPPDCSTGTYNPATDQCEELSPATCPVDTLLNVTTDLCEATPTCPAGTALNTTTDVCALRIVGIDIKPNDPKNTISIKNDKSVRVAILGSTITPVSDIDITPLSTDAPKFGGSTPRAPVGASLEDVNGDGLIDLVLKYNSGKSNPLGFASGDTVGCINGKLNDGTPVTGCDFVRIIK